MKNEWIYFLRILTLNPESLGKKVKKQIHFSHVALILFRTLLEFEPAASLECVYSMCVCFWVLESTVRKAERRLGARCDSSAAISRYQISDLFARDKCVNVGLKRALSEENPSQNNILVVVFITQDGFQGHLKQAVSISGSVLLLVILRLISFF